MADAMQDLMKAIMKAEKQFGDDHRYRHVFSALREARYASHKLSANDEFNSPGRQEAMAVASKAHVPDAEDSRNPNVPSEKDGNGESVAATDGSTSV